MLLDGEKISKSLGNSILVTDIVDKGYDPLSLRYLILTTHYKTGLNFSWQSLDAASTAYKKLKESVLILKTNSFSDSVSDEQFNKFKQEFEGCLADDLNFAKAIGLVWQIVRAADLNHVTKLALVLDFDKVLGLKLDEIEQEKIEIPENIKRLVSLRDEARASKDFTRSDTLRAEIESLGFEVKDTPEGTKVNKK
jgi:cysteinyl-tRNA synthetase